MHARVKAVLEKLVLGGWSTCMLTGTSLLYERLSVNEKRRHSGTDPDNVMTRYLENWLFYRMGSKWEVKGGVATTLV